MSGYAKGGLIGPDSIPAWVPDNSYVLNATQTRRWLDLLKQINKPREDEK